MIKYLEISLKQHHTLQKSGETEHCNSAAAKLSQAALQQPQWNTALEKKPSLYSRFYQFPWMIHWPTKFKDSVLKKTHIAE